MSSTTNQEKLVGGVKMRAINYVNNKSSGSIFMSIFKDDKDIIFRYTENPEDIYNGDDINIGLNSFCGLYKYIDFMDIDYTDKAIGYNENRRDIQYRILKNNGISTPKTACVFISNTTYIRLIKILMDAGFDLLDTSAPLVIRPATTARSLGNMVCKVSDLEYLIECIVECRIIDREKRKENDYSVISEKIKEYGFILPDENSRGWYRNKDEQYRLETIFADRPAISIQEVISFKEEYRFYYHFGMAKAEDLLFAIKRKGFSLTPKKDEMKEECLDIDSDFKSFTTMKETLNKMISMFKKYKTLTASMDIYIDDKGEVGCFEYSHEYSADGVPPFMLSRFISGFKEAILNYDIANRDVNN